MLKGLGGRFEVAVTVKSERVENGPRPHDALRVSWSPITRATMA
jgi:hypothetical protein